MPYLINWLWAASVKPRRQTHCPDNNYDAVQSSLDTSASWSKDLEMYANSIKGAQKKHFRDVEALEIVLRLTVKLFRKSHLKQLSDGFAYSVQIRFQCSRSPVPFSKSPGS